MDYDSLKDILPKQVKSWFEQEVFIWLKFISLEQYFPYFQNKQLFGRKLFELNEEIFQHDFQIKSKIIRKKFMYWIRIGLAEYDTYLSNNGITQKSQNSQSQSYFNRQFKSQFFQCSEEQNYFLKRRQSQSQTRKLSKSKNQIFDMKKSLKLNKIKNQLILTEGTQKQAKLCYSFVNRGGYIGRHSSCQVMVLQDNVALQNCYIQYRQPNFYLNKFEYKYGTWKFITVKIKMNQWSMIEMGDNVFKFQIFTNGQIKVQVVDGPNKKQKFKFQRQKINKIKIGRKPNNQVHFLSDSSLSMYHARLTFQCNHWYFQDIGSTNGSWLFLEKQQLITSGMMFKVGRTMEIFRCQLRNQNLFQKQKKGIQLCQKCLINKKNSILNPCNHNVFCHQCSLTQKYCAKCHAKIINSTKIFHS